MNGKMGRDEKEMHVNYIDSDMSQRLNIMKLIFMIMVVFIHSHALPELAFDLSVPKYVDVFKNIVTGGISGAAVPSFFLISGILLFNKDFTWIGNMTKKIRSILVPYFLINSFWIVFFKTMRAFPVTASYFSGETYQITGLNGVIKAYLDPIPLYYPFWFLRDLFIVNIFAKGIEFLVKRFPIVAVVLMLAIELNLIPIPFVVTGSAFGMFIIGCLLVNYGIPIQKTDGLPLLCLGMLYIAFTAAKLFLVDAAWFTLFYVIIGFIFWYRLSGIAVKSKMAAAIFWCSQFSFFIYAFHEFYEAMLKKIIMSILPQYGFVQLIEFIVLPIMVTGICIAVGAFAKKRMPGLYRIVCGLR